MTENNFLPIPDAPGDEINSKGFVRNIRTGKILKPCKCKDRITPKIHIPKYNIRRTVESLRRQAVVAHNEIKHESTFELIPNTNGLYEINPRGVVRNTKTKYIKKTRLCNGCKCVMLSVKGKSVNRGIDSLLWEVHGKIFRKQHPRVCSVKIEKDNEKYFFRLQKDCINFICRREYYNKDYVRKKLNRRVKIFSGWKISYTEFD